MIRRVKDRMEIIKPHCGNVTTNYFGRLKLTPFRYGLYSKNMRFDKQLKGKENLISDSIPNTRP